MVSVLKRHPEISVRSPKGINKAHARVTEESIRLWFHELDIILAQEGHMDILPKSERIFNGNESGFSLCPKTGRVLGQKVIEISTKLKPATKNIALQYSQHSTLLVRCARY